MIPFLLLFAAFSSAWASGRPQDVSHFLQTDDELSLKDSGAGQDSSASGAPKDQQIASLQQALEESHRRELALEKKVLDLYQKEAEISQLKAAMENLSVASQDLLSEKSRAGATEQVAVEEEKSTTLPPTLRKAEGEDSKRSKPVHLLSSLLQVMAPKESKLGGAKTHPNAEDLEEKADKIERDIAQASERAKDLVKTLKTTGQSPEDQPF